LDLSLSAIIEHIGSDLAQTASSVSVEFALEARELAVLSGSAHVYDDPYLIVQLTDGNQGYVFAHPNEISMQDMVGIVGKPIRTIKLSELPTWLAVALLDAMTPVCKGLPEPSRSRRLSGAAQYKSEMRAQFIANLLPLQDTTNVAVIGGIEDIVKQISASAKDVRIADFHLAGTKLCGIEVETDYMSLLDWCDVALITGNTLKTDTLSDICSVIQRRNIYANIYAMTGHNLFPAIMADLPFRWVTAETFPFYWFAGSDSAIRAFKSKA